jgi:radical SAM superfamily enzyme YgiQ (UPF0313 family)
MFVMTGLPGQNDEDVRQTLAFLRTAGPAAVTVKPFHRYPGLDMAPADANEERERGERQATLAEHELNLPPGQRGGLVARARRWAARRFGG